MKKYKNYILTSLIFLCSLSLLGQSKLALINDPDGFTYVREGQGMNYKVIDTLYKDDFFYFEFSDSSEWARIAAWEGPHIVGFVHISRIQEAEKLDHAKQKQLITKELKEQKVLADRYQKAWNSKVESAYETCGKDWIYHTDTKYDPILIILPIYFCATNDTEVIQLFFATSWSNKSSASESPSFAIGDCFICNSDIVIEQLRSIKVVEQKKHIIDQIEWGLLNNFDVAEDGTSRDKEYTRLKALLDIERNSNH